MMKLLNEPPDGQAPTKSWSAMGKWVLVFAAALALLILIIILLLNGLLSSAWGRKQIEQISEKLSTKDIHWSIGRASYWPWEGLTLRDISATVVDPHAKDTSLPFVHIDQILIVPELSHALRGNLKLSQLVVDHPVAYLNPENLAALLPNEEPPTKQASMAQADQKPPKPAPETTTQSAKRGQRPRKLPRPTTQNTKSAKTKAPESRGQKEQKSRPQKQEETPKPKRLPLLPDIVSIREGELHISQGATTPKKIAALTGIHLEMALPAHAQTNAGLISIENLQLLGQAHTQKKAIPIDWTGEHAEIQIDRHIKGLRTQAKISLSLAHTSLPWTAQVRLPQQAFQDGLPEGWHHAHLSIDKLGLFLIAHGHLVAPSSWASRCQAAFRGMTIYSDLREDRIAFDYGTLRTLSRGASLGVSELQLRSDRFSIMSHGALQASDKRIQGVVRFVADEEYSAQITRISIGSLISRGWVSNWLQPFNPPDRYYRDLLFRGTWPDWQINAGRKGEWISLLQALDLIQQFLEREEQEDLQNNPTPNPATPTPNP